MMLVSAQVKIIRKTYRDSFFLVVCYKDTKLLKIKKFLQKSNIIEIIVTVAMHLSI